jgi:hypothetical protein
MNFYRHVEIQNICSVQVMLLLCSRSYVFSASATDAEYSLERWQLIGYKINRSFNETEVFIIPDLFAKLVVLNPINLRFILISAIHTHLVSRSSHFDVFRLQF